MPVPSVIAPPSTAGTSTAGTSTAGTSTAGTSTAFSVEAVAQLLQPETRRAFDLNIVKETGSTNSDLLRDAARLPSGSVLAAERQSAGRGRRGRAWIAPPGGSLAFSLLWKFERDAAALSGLSLAAGVAAARALERCGAAMDARFGVRLKWPNDLLVQDDGGWAKLGGILIELAATEAGRTPAVIGIGINLALGAAASAIDQRTIDLASLGATCSCNTALAYLLDELLPVLRGFEQTGFAPFAGDWTARHAFGGKRVVLSSEQGAGPAGIALGADADGALLLDTGHGIQRIVSGEVSLRAG